MMGMREDFGATARRLVRTHPSRTTPAVDIRPAGNNATPDTRPARSVRWINRPLLDSFQVLSISFAAPLVSDDIKGYALSLVQSPHACLLHSADMNKHVR